MNISNFPFKREWRKKVSQGAFVVQKKKYLRAGLLPGYLDGLYKKTDSKQGWPSNFHENIGY